MEYNHIVNQYRKEATGDKRKNPIRKLLLKKYSKLDWHVKKAVDRWLEENPKVKEVYLYKEAIHRFYSTKGKKQARKTLIKLTDQMSHSTIPEVRTLRNTLREWLDEIVNFFENKLTNGKTEGFNRVGKLIQRNAYGFRNYENYRKRLIYKTS